MEKVNNLMRNVKLTLEFDGTNYAGWQKQKNAITVQQMLEEAIKSITNEEIETIGSSRTDAGVHARGFVCNFHTSSKIPAERLSNALNSKLPRDIVVLNSEEVSDEFHSRYDCKGKTYSYTILNRAQPPAMHRNYLYHYKKDLAIESMQEAVIYFKGTHDFSAFKNAGSSAKTSTRTITRLDVEKQNDIIKIFASADGFLYNMVRIIVGTLIEIGIGKMRPQEINNIILSKDRSNAGKAAPPNGLCLEEAYY